ncbi:Electron transport complex subunit RsxB [bioreactor metagenome]|uniref:Electron transport complex subunit RsxB n=1 Tax=bioreactor metagenome TaxID=1076179 RepID=A0A644WEU5_9ZZZZ
MKTNQLQAENISVVYTSKALCRDCYRCVRVCPVNAIRMKDGQANVVAERCISCGTCITVCPQNAKTYRTEYGKVLQMLEDKERLAISLAPSFVSYYSEWERSRIPSALRMLGFSIAAETASAAWHTAMATAEHVRLNSDKPVICTACPAAVNYIRSTMLDLIPYLAPVASPMLMHARQIKAANPGIRFVFAGPCTAKKDEERWKTAGQNIDAVITFEELDELFRLRNISLQSCEESTFDSTVNGLARLFPVEGGLLKTGEIVESQFDQEILSLSGAEEIAEVLEDLRKHPKPCVIEPLFCRNGCTNGPVMHRGSNSFETRRLVLEYAQQHPGSDATDEIIAKDTNAYFPPFSESKRPVFSEEKIREVLGKTGKLIPSDELNCTACGYKTCRDRAIAVLEDMAEPEMCMPYMRRLAEQKADTIIERDPNGFVLLNSNLEIIRMNQAFKAMFTCSDSLAGRKISYLIDPRQFELLISGKDDTSREFNHYPNYNLMCHTIAYKLPEEDQIVGLFIDVTESKSSKDKLIELRSETVQHAQELIDHQIAMAQELARFLGENTARGEVLMKNLIDSIKK